MAVQRPSLQKLMLQTQLNKFYSHPVARVSFGLVMTIITIVFFALVAIRPTLLTMAELIRTIDDKKIIDQQLSQKIAALSSAQAEIALHQNAAQILDIAIPSTPNFTLLLKQIEKLASEQNVILSSLTIQSVPVERDPTKVNLSQLQSIPLTLIINGSYDNLTATLKTLYSMQRLIVIDRIDLLPPTSQDTSVLTLSISMRAFAFGLDPNAKIVTQGSQ